ncbi:hypothetical protein POM88_028320 [Heracleum sosnowskyi]|uniref:PDZ domain-containing protein n=1 Tax=Heracleum sosnowskyi TaxID=360622 RepID=A0AAD8I9N8_9APIA|nr:hypothetical protein POM88_028320 [Heracleum sosnowskyi]
MSASPYNSMKTRNKQKDENVAVSGLSLSIKAQDIGVVETCPSNLNYAVHIAYLDAVLRKHLSYLIEKDDKTDIAELEAIKEYPAKAIRSMHQVVDCLPRISIFGPTVGSCYQLHWFLSKEWRFETGCIPLTDLWGLEELLDWDMGLGIAHPDFMDVALLMEAPDHVNFDTGIGLVGQMNNLGLGQVNGPQMGNVNGMANAGVQEEGGIQEEIIQGGLGLNDNLTFAGDTPLEARHRLSVNLTSLRKHRNLCIMTLYPEPEVSSVFVPVFLIYPCFSIFRVIFQFNFSSLVEGIFDLVLMAEEELMQMSLIDRDKMAKDIEELRKMVLVNKDEHREQLDKLWKDMENFKKMILFDKEVFKKVILLDLEGYKQKMLEVAKDEEVGFTFVEREEEGYVPDTSKVLYTLGGENKAESILEEHNGHEDLNDPSSSYNSMSPPESIWKPYHPNPANNIRRQPRRIPRPNPYPSPSPSPDLGPQFTRSPSCISHHDARSYQSPDTKNSDHVHTSVDKIDLSGVYSDFAPSVVSVSSFIGETKIIDCSGLIIDWSSDDNEAIILTSAKLLWSPKSSGFDLHMIVRLGDGTLLLATKDNVDYYHNLITLKVKSAIELKVVDLAAKKADIVGGMDVCALGRSFYTCTLTNSPGELHLQNPLFGCDDLLRSTCSVSVICEGGPLISDVGFVVGMNFFGNCVCHHLLPTPIILNCLDMWRSYRTVVRPLIGMSVVDVYPVPLKIWKRFKISPEHPYVAVKEVYKGSLADMNDVRSGDLIATCNGVVIKSSKQYYELVSETSRAVTSCGDSGQLSLSVVINPYDGRSDSVSIEADNVPVNDSQFHKCWPRVEDDGWSRLKLKLFMLKLKNDCDFN